MLCSVYKIIKNINYGITPPPPNSINYGATPSPNTINYGVTPPNTINYGVTFFSTYLDNRRSYRSSTKGFIYATLAYIKVSLSVVLRR